MKIQAIPISPSTDAATKLDAEVVRFKVSGPVDANDEVMRRAREFVLGTGSQAMIESFDWALQHANFVAED